MTRRNWHRLLPTLAVAAATSALAVLGITVVSPSAGAGHRGAGTFTTSSVPLPIPTVPTPTSSVAPTTSTSVASTPATTSVPAPTAPTLPRSSGPTSAPTTTNGPITASAVAPCTPVSVPGGVFAVGDSVMVDAAELLQRCMPNMEVDAAVSRQWSDGETVMRQVMARAARPAVVVVDLGTNGPIADADFNTMMQILAPAARVVFVTVHVDRSWQGQVNGVLARGVLRYPTAVLADWWAVSSPHPEWFYADGTHMPINGPGTQALADLITARV
jgi:hypothetical protein